MMARKQDQFMVVVADDHGYGEATEEDLADNPFITLHPFGRIEGDSTVNQIQAWPQSGDPNHSHQ